MIVKDIDTLKDYIPTVVGDDFSLFKPYVATAEQWLKDEIIGDKLYELVCQLSDDDKTLLGYCQKLVCFNAYEQAIPFLDLIQTDNGFAIASTDNLAPASRERVDALIAASKTQQDNAIENLQAYLEETEKYHEKWKDTPVYSMLTDTLIHTLKVFRRYAPLTPENSRIYPRLRRDFIALHANMREAMLFKIASVSSPELLDEIVLQLQKGNLNDANKKLLEPLRFALVCFTLNQPNKADEYLRRVLSMLKTKPEDYSTWKNSTVGQAELNKAHNKNDKTIFFAGI